MIIKIKIISYRSRRGYYAGIETKVVSALAIMWQRDHTLVVELQEQAFNYPKGYNIAINQSQIII